MSKKRGEFDIVFAVDCETSGINYKSDDLTSNYQSISWGIIATSQKDFKVIDKLYVEIQHDDSIFLWDWKAEKIHGLSRDHLSKHGETAEDAAAIIGEFFLKHNDGIKKPIVLLGHNVAVFDRPFLKKLMHTHGLDFKFAHRCLDTFSLSMGTVKEFNSDDLFSRFGMPLRKEHNALDDAECALKVYRYVSNIWNNMIDNN